jgi:hypothetical protein
MKAISLVTQVHDIPSDLNSNMYRLRLGHVTVKEIRKRVRPTWNCTKSAVFWAVTPCGSCKNGLFGGSYRLQHQGGNNRWTRNVSLTSNRRTPITSNVVPRSPILFILMEAIRCYETLVLTRVTHQSVIPEDDILHRHRRENLKSYNSQIVPPPPQSQNLMDSEDGV